MQKLTPYLIKIIGLFLLIVGLIAAYYGPIEIFVFYLFSKGGPFYYDGFGVGSFWFASLVVQNIGYYMVASICIPIGLGHLKFRRWALSLTQLFIWFWLGTGILFAGNLLRFIPQVLDLDINQEILIKRLSIIVILFIFIMILLPILTQKFYRSEKVKLTFEERIQKTYWTEKYPITVLALLLLFGIMIIIMHLAIFFQGIFPFFGKVILGRQSIYFISLNILVLGILIIGVIQLKTWAWWSSLLYLLLLSTSTIIAFTRQNFYEIILMMNLPSSEMEFFNNLAILHDLRLASLFTPPLIIGLSLLIYSKNYFGQFKM